MTKSMRGIFNDLTANRQEKAAAAKHFVVIGLTKSGKPYKVTAQDLQYNATRTLEEAETRRLALKALNPAKTFVILPL